MDLLLKLSDDQSYANPLSVLLNVIKTEFKQFKFAMISANKLAPETFQITSFCSEFNCPVYSAEEMLHGSLKFPILVGKFVESWKTKTSAFRMLHTNCPDLFQGELKSFSDALVIPIWIKGKVERWIVLVDYDVAPFSLGRESNSETELSKLSLLLNYALTNIIRTEQKHQLDKARRWIDEELTEISRLQSLLLPNKDLVLNGAQHAFTFKAFKETGGDYLDLFQLPSDSDYPDEIKWGGIIADVTGHGPSAAVEAAMVDAILRTFPGNKDTTPADAANYLNQHFFTRRDRGKFVTAKLFSYRSDTKILRYVSAGHPNGYVKRGSDVMILDKSKGIPIGVLPDYQWGFKEVLLTTGDILFIYTDVVLETRNSKGEEFGEIRLQEIISQAENCPTKLINDVEQSLLSFNGKDELLDDLTLAAIKIV